MHLGRKDERFCAEGERESFRAVGGGFGSLLSRRQNPGRALKEVGIAMLGAGGFAAGHGVAADEVQPGREALLGLGDKFGFGGAGIGQEGLARPGG